MFTSTRFDSRVITFLVLLLISTSCRTQTDTRAADEAALRKLDDEWSKAIGARDFEKAMSYYSDDAVQTHAARAGLPLRSRTVAAQTGKLLARLTAVGRAKQRGIFDAGVNSVGIVE